MSIRTLLEIQANLRTDTPKQQDDDTTPAETKIGYSIRLNASLVVGSTGHSLRFLPHTCELLENGTVICLTLAHTPPAKRPFRFIADCVEKVHCHYVLRGDTDGKRPVPHTLQIRFTSPEREDEQILNIAL